MLTASEGENSPALEDVLLQELQARPTDVQLRVSNSYHLQDAEPTHDAGEAGDLVPEDREDRRRMGALYES